MKTIELKGSLYKELNHVDQKDLQDYFHSIKKDRWIFLYCNMSSKARFIKSGDQWIIKNIFELPYDKNIK